MPDHDPLAKLKALTKSSSGAVPFEHETEDEVLRKLTSILAKTETGNRLLQAAHGHGTQIRILKGRGDFSFAPESNIVYIGMPAGQSAPKARMLLYMAMGLEEARQEYEGIPRPPVMAPTAQKAEINIQKQTDIHFQMCAVAHELIQNLGLREILDEIAKMGNTDLYEAYLEELRTAP